MTVLMHYEYTYVWNSSKAKYETQTRIEPRVQFGFSW